MEALPSWFRDSVLVLILITLILILIRYSFKILGSEFVHFVGAIRTEVRDGLRNAKTIGAWNAYLLVVITIFGVIVIASAGAQKLLGVIFSFFNAKKGAELVQYTNYFHLFFVLALLFVISIVSVVIDNRRPK